MNLNSIKRGFTSTNPEKGLRNLSGARKADRIDDSTSTMRVKGRYISGGNDKIGQFFGMMGYIHAWLYVILMPCSLVAGDDYISSPISIFIIGFAIVHGCAMFADGLRNSNAPWATKGIKIFWIFSLLLVVYGVVASMMVG